MLGTQTIKYTERFTRKYEFAYGFLDEINKTEYTYQNKICDERLF